MASQSAFEFLNSMLVCLILGHNEPCKLSAYMFVKLTSVVGQCHLSMLFYCMLNFAIII